MKREETNTVSKSGVREVTSPSDSLERANQEILQTTLSQQM